MNWQSDIQQQLSHIRWSSSEGELYKHSHDESSHPPSEPDLVCYPTSTEEVAEVVLYASANGIPLTPFGVGSGLDGAAIPLYKGISINFDEMNRVVKLSLEDLTVSVQPGMTRLALNQVINRHGLFFPLDPGADATLGGMAATNASGTTAVRYGVMRDQILALTVVLPDGRIIKTSSAARKSSSGYHLTGLFVGSEGTLGIITELTLKLHGIPESTVAATCQFETVSECTVAAHMLLQSGLSVMRMELVDATSIAQINQANDYSLPVAHSLFLEFAGSPKQVMEELEIAEAILVEMGAREWKVATSQTDRQQLWKARHEIAYAFRHLSGVSVVGADVCVPLSQLAPLTEKARTWIDESGLLGSVFGHIGDGNFHTLVVYKSDSDEERERAERINEWIVKEAIEVGGTSTGEHGVGIGKMKYQQAEHGEAYGVMQQLKELFDPKGIMNPGKVLLLTKSGGDSL